ncbi:hypothetical protein [Streptomyces yaizuensis]|uniref:Uncharacterized protein n=1 Tax=Streptomyces yaizuensis TaxID=2989713 RepID=A0AA86IZD8_9ACTN|nr:hypothetical protein [Streptomyces sp. YSPA8]BDT39666.1 hypothetical protein SYYSPA8_37740 [Streptomyces sp. YSPA8]
MTRRPWPTTDMLTAITDQLAVYEAEGGPPAVAVDLAAALRAHIGAAVTAAEGAGPATRAARQARTIALAWLRTDPHDPACPDTRYLAALATAAERIQQVVPKAPVRRSTRSTKPAETAAKLAGTARGAGVVYACIHDGRDPERLMPRLTAWVQQVHGVTVEAMAYDTGPHTRPLSERPGWRKVHRVITAGGVMLLAVPALAELTGPGSQRDRLVHALAGHGVTAMTIPRHWYPRTDPRTWRRSR